MDNIYKIKDRLNEALSLRGMTAAELANAAGMYKSSLSRYLTGENIPRSKAIGKLAQALNVSPAWILGYDVPMELDTLPGGGYHGSTETAPIEYEKLNKDNQARLLAYYQALIDSQEDTK